MEWPSDKSLKEWYDAAILCDENHIMNEAFMSARLEPLLAENPSLLEGQLEPDLIQPMTLVHTFRDATTGTMMTTNNHFSVLMIEEPKPPVSEPPPRSNLQRSDPLTSHHY